MLTVAELLETMADPQTAHAAAVHAPIVLAGVAAALALASAGWMARQRTLRWLTLIAAGLAAASAFYAKQTGERAFDAMGDPPAVARQIAENHEALAERTLIVSFGVAALAGLAFLPRAGWAAGGAWLAALGASGLVWQVASTAQLGGTLVYDYGVGTPRPLTENDLSPSGRRSTGDPRLEFYRVEVEPVLARYCFSCHGSVAAPAGGLSLTTARGLLAGGDRGPAIVPGDAEASLLYQAISGAHPELSMPPTPRRPSDRQIEAVREWIEDGAVWAPGE